MYELYHKDILAISYYYLGNIQEAEEITQEVFIRYSKNMDKLLESKEGVNIQAWLKRVAVNLCFDGMRRAGYALKYSLVPLNRIIFGDDKKIEIRDEINDLLGKLDKKSRMVLILKYMEEMDYQEISKIMGISVGTLKSMASRAIKKIK